MQSNLYSIADEESCKLICSGQVIGFIWRERSKTVRLVLTNLKLATTAQTFYGDLSKTYVIILILSCFVKCFVETLFAQKALDLFLRYRKFLIKLATKQNPSAVMQQFLRFLDRSNYCCCTYKSCCVTALFNVAWTFFNFNCLLFMNRFRGMNNIIK